MSPSVTASLAAAAGAAPKANIVACSLARSSALMLHE